MTNVEKIIEEAYKLYMPQDKYEITELTQFIKEQMTVEIEDVSMGRGEMKVPVPFNVLEIGTKFGGTFYIWNKLVQDHGAGVCISIDMSDGGIHGGIEDEKMDKRDLWFAERFSNCQFIRGDSHSSITSAILCEILFNKNWNDIDVWTDDYKKLDFLFIDGDHSYEGVKKDFEIFTPFVKTGGIIAFHDTVISQRHHDREVYVGEFWRDLTKFKKSDDPTLCMIDGEWYKIHEFVKGGLDWAGIGVLVKL